MAQVHFTLDSDEILALLSQSKSDGLALLLQEALNSFLKVESALQLHAEPYERTSARTGSRNGFRKRPYATRIGTLTLNVPKHRNGESFHSLLFDNYTRSEAALICTMAEMVVNGVSTRKVSQVMEILCGKSVSKSSVSEACKELDESVAKFKNRPLDAVYPFVTIDATYFKVRTNSRTCAKALMIAYATTCEGVQEVIGFGAYDGESKETWNEFLKSLKERGLAEIYMITSDAHEGIIDAVAKQFPKAAWQRCQFHFMRNIVDKMPKKFKEGIKSELSEMFNTETVTEARKLRDNIIKSYSDIAEKAMKCLDEGFESSMSIMVLPTFLRLHYRTSNHIERLNKELKRRSKAIGTFMGEESLIRLMGAVLLERNEMLADKKRLFRAETYKKIMTPELELKLVAIAQEQRHLLDAA